LDFYNLFDPSSILPNFILLFFIFITVLTLIFFIPLLKKYKYIFISNILFILIYFSFACWWEPNYREFWVAPMFSFWILSFYIINFIMDKTKTIQPVSSILVYSFLFLIIFLLFYFNFTGFIYPNASNKFRAFDIINNIK
jgi:hypothetical protein